jgi:hypothetical protein
MQKKRIISVAVTLILLLTSAFAASAENSIETVKSGENQQSVITPMFTYISAMGAALKISSGTAICTGTLTINKNYSSVMTMTLQRSSNGTTWTSVTTPWTQSYPSSGDFTLEKRYSPLTSGYTYRVKVTVNVGGGLETATTYSQQIYY